MGISGQYEQPRSTNRYSSSYSKEGHYLGQDSGVALVAPGDRNTILAILTQGESPVLMAQSSHGKPIPSNRSVILAVRDGCVRAVQCAGDNPITVIGLSLPAKDDPDDDPVLADLFDAIRSHRESKIYVGKDETECNRARQEYGMDARCVGLGISRRPRSCWRAHAPLVTLYGSR